MKKKNIKHIVISVLFALCALFFCAACGSSEKEYDYELFEKSYTCEFGSSFLLPQRSYKGSAIIYEVKSENKAVEVFNNTFQIASMSEYNVTVKYKNGEIISVFTVIPTDNMAPDVLFEQGSYVVYVGEEFVLPEVGVFDNVDGEITEYVEELYFNGSQISFSKTNIPDCTGEYEYRITATDGNNNTSVRSAYFPAKERKYVNDMAFALNSSYGIKEQIKPIYGADMSVSDEIRFGDEPSLKIDFDKTVDTVSLRFGNSYVNDISEYDYLFFSVYSKLDVGKMISVNWTSLYGSNLKSDEWVDFIIPIDENLTGSSFNALISSKDWKNPDNLTLFLQSGKSLIGGSIYLSNVYLIKTDKATFLSEGNDYLGATEKESFRNGYKKLTAEYNCLSEEDKTDASSVMSGIKKQYFRLEVLYSGDEYNPDTVFYGSKSFSKNMIKSAGNNWNLVGYDENVKRTANSQGSATITFVEEYHQPNACMVILDSPITNTAGYSYAKLYAYNGLKDYDESKIVSLAFMGAKTGATVKSAADGWVEYYLPLPEGKNVVDTWLVCQVGEYGNYGYPTGSMFIDDITFIKDDDGVPEDSGTYCSFDNEFEVQRNVSVWSNDNFALSTEVKYNGANTLAMSLIPRGGRSGVILSYSKMKKLFAKENVKSVTVEFYYKTSDATGANYISLAYNGFTAVNANGEWQKYSVILNADTDYSGYFVLLFSYDVAGAFINRPMSGTVYISSPTYKCNY